MATEFYKSIPESIKGKLEEYYLIYGRVYIRPEYCKSFINMFDWHITPEGGLFWENHWKNNTFPQWSDKLNRFIDPPQVNTICVNADEYQAMRDWVLFRLKAEYNYNKELTHVRKCVLEIAESFGIDINEITN